MSTESHCLIAGVLRNAVRQRAAGSLFQTPQSIVAGEAGADELATWFSHPTWMVDRWLGRYGFAGTVALLHHNNRCGRGLHFILLALSGLAEMGTRKSNRHRDADLRMCAQLRRPAYGVRVNCGTTEMSTERFVEDAKSQGVAAEISSYLPDEFVRVHSGMQVNTNSSISQ
jgi:hypothetical protein